jgi:cytochrome c biogenesis protein CcdA
VAASIVTAFFGGLLSFLSPCVLPLVPPYLCFITGEALDDLTGKATISRQRTMLAALAFVLGFSTVFILLGATASAAGQIVREYLPILAQIAGFFIILMLSSGDEARGSDWRLWGRACLCLRLDALHRASACHHPRGRGIGR